MRTSAIACVWVLGALAVTGCGGGQRAAGKRGGPSTQGFSSERSTRAHAASGTSHLAVVVGASRRVWGELTPARLSRTEVAAARLGDSIYVVGGFEATSGRSTAAVERLDLRTGRWSLSRPMPVALNHMGVASYAGSLHVLGGYLSRTDTNSDATASFWRYQPGLNRWTAMPRAPTPRAAFAIAVLGDRLYAAGGRNDTTLALRSVDAFDFERRRWIRASSLNVGREHVAGVVGGGAVYVLGGREVGVGNFATVERYTPRAGRWQQLSPMPNARSGFGAAAIGGKIVVVGGEGPRGVIGEVDTLDLTSGVWHRATAMRTPRHGLGVVGVGPVVLALEGGPVVGLSFSRTVERLRVG